MVDEIDHLVSDNKRPRIHVAISLPRGFIWHKESSCSGSLVDEIPEADLLSAIRINCVSDKSWKGISPEGESLTNKLGFGEPTVADGCKFFYIKYPDKLIQGLLARLSFGTNVQSISFYTPRNVVNGDEKSGMEAIEDILSTSIISPQCLIFVNSESRSMRDERADLTYLYDLPRTFNYTGKRLLDEKKYDLALESFYSAISTFPEVESAFPELEVPFPSLTNLVVDIYYRILQTYMVHDPENIPEQVVMNAYLNAIAPKEHGKPLESFDLQGMQDCIIICAKIYEKWGALYRIRDYAEDAIFLNHSYKPAQTLRTQATEIMRQRKEEGYFPPLKSLENGTAMEGKVECCFICKKNLSSGQKFTRNMICSHVFHRRCISNRLSQAFPLSDHRCIDALKDIFIGEMSLPDLKCLCGGKVDLSSMMTDQLFDWLLDVDEGIFEEVRRALEEKRRASGEDLPGIMTGLKLYL